ncbi:MAG: hypothetical protein NVSMB25_22190 [Thermoleophilaceae bacterium]
MIVLRTFGTRPRRLLTGRRPERLTEAEPAAVPTVRATLIRAEPLGGGEEAERWLEGLRRDRGKLEPELRSAEDELNSVLRAHRAAAADRFTREISARGANVARVGYGGGDLVAEGRYSAAFDVPDQQSRRRRARIEALGPQERLAGILAGKEPLLASEELVLRARTDIDACRPREAALQARIALEALLAELPRRSAALSEHRDPVAAAANVALAGDPQPSLVSAVEDAVAAMEQALAHDRTQRASNPSG